MKITLNLYQPNFKAIQLSDNEKKQVSYSLNSLQNEDLSDFKKCLIKCDVMDIFYPHIQKEAAYSKDSKTKFTDLNIKMFEALNSFNDKKDPLGWFLSILNGTAYKDPKPTILELLDEQERLKEEEYYRKKQELQNVANTVDICQRPVNNINKSKFFNTDTKDKNYTKKDIIKRAKELAKSSELKYPLKTLINLVEENPYLIEYDNDEIELYFEDFSKAVDVSKDLIKKAIIQKPKIMALNFDYINKHIQDVSDLMGLDKEFCKYEMFSMPKLIFTYPQTIKSKSDAMNFYKTVRNKNSSEIPCFNATTVKMYYLRTMNFLIGKADKAPLYASMDKEEKLVEYLKNRKTETYHFILPKHKMTNPFIDYAKKFSEKNLGKNIFTFEIIDQEDYAAIETPKSLAHYKTKAK